MKMKLYRRQGPEEPGYFCPIKKSVALSRRIIEDVDKIMVQEKVDNFSWMVRRLLRLSIERYDTIPDEIRLGQTQFTIIPPVSLSEILMITAERLCLPPDYVIIECLTNGINTFVERANRSKMEIEKMREAVHRGPARTVEVEEVEEVEEEDLELEEVE